jgi:hypothetical protein
MLQDTTLGKIKSFIEEYSLKQASIARDVQIEKAIFNCYLVEGPQRHHFYGHALVDMPVEMRSDNDQVIPI